MPVSDGLAEYTYSGQQGEKAAPFFWVGVHCSLEIAALTMNSIMLYPVFVQLLQTILFLTVFFAKSSRNLSNKSWMLSATLDVAFFVSLMGSFENDEAVVYRNVLLGLSFLFSWSKISQMALHEKYYAAGEGIPLISESRNCLSNNLNSFIPSYETFFAISAVLSVMASTGATILSCLSQDKNPLTSSEETNVLQLSGAGSLFSNTLLASLSFCCAGDNPSTFRMVSRILLILSTLALVGLTDYELSSGLHNPLDAAGFKVMGVFASLAATAGFGSMLDSWATSREVQTTRSDVEAGVQRDESPVAQEDKSIFSGIVNYFKSCSGWDAKRKLDHAQLPQQAN